MVEIAAGVEHVTVEGAWSSWRCDDALEKSIGGGIEGELRVPYLCHIQSNVVEWRL